LHATALKCVAAAVAAVTTAPAEVNPARVQASLGTPFISPFAAPTDAGYLLLWEDGRHGPYDAIFGGYEARAYGTRVDTSGNVLDTAGVSISPDPFDQSDPEAACIGGQCLVVWQQASRGTWGRLFNPFTAAWGPEVELSPAGGNALAVFQVPRVVVTGGHYLIFWDDDLGLSARPVSTGGSPMGAAQVLDAPGNHATLRVAATATAAIAVWISGGTVYSQVTTPTGVPVGVLTVLGAGDTAILPAAAGVGTTFLAAWADPTGFLAFRRISDSGVVLDPTVSYPLGATRATIGQFAISDGTDFIVGFEDGQLHFARLSAANLTVLMAPASVAAGNTSTGSLSVSQPSGGTALVSWGQPQGVFPDLLAIGLLDLTTAGNLALSGVTRVLQNRSDVQITPAASRWGSGFAVAYGSVITNQWVPFVATFDNLGARAGAAVRLDASATDLLGLALHYEPQTQVTRAVWGTTTALKTCVVDALGQPSPPVTLSAAGPIYEPRMTSLGGRTFVIWEDRTAGFELRGRYIEADGGFGPVAQLLAGTDSFWPYDVAASAAQLGLVWTNGGPQTTSFGLVNGSMMVLITAPSLPNPNRPISIALGSDQSGFLVAWNADDASPVGAVRVGPMGNLLDAQQIAVSAPQENTPSLDPSQPQVIFDGRAYVVAWTERVADGGGEDIYRRRVDPDGGLEPVEVVAGGPRSQHTPALALGTPGRILTAWLDTQDPTDDVMRAWKSVTLDVPSGLPCTVAEECASNKCSAAGVCCDVADGGCGSAPTDGGFDGGTDAGMDAGADAGMDAGAHAGMDAGVDGGADAGPGASPLILSAGCGCNSSGALGLLALVALCPRRRNRPDLCYRR
jgi:hypothetical protein